MKLKDILKKPGDWRYESLSEDSVKNDIKDVYRVSDIQKIVKVLGENTVLDNMDISIIQNYIRNKKLNKIKNNIK